MFLSFKWFSLLALICMGCAPLQNRMVAWTGTSDGQTAAPTAFESSFSVGRAYEAQGNYRQAEEVYGKLVAHNPENHLLQHRLGVLAVRQGRLDEANSHFEKALKSAPDDAELLTDIGYALYLQGRYDDAEQRLRSVVGNNPDNKRAANNLGMVLAKTGHGSEAYRVFRKTGSDAQAHSNLAYVYANIGELDLAEKHYSRALDFDDSLTQASDALLQLDEIRRDLDEGAVLQAAGPLHPQASNEPTQEVALTPQPMENPDSAEFASRWRQQATGRNGTAASPETFQFQDEFYESKPDQVTSAVHHVEQNDSEDRRPVLQTSGINSPNRN